MKWMSLILALFFLCLDLEPCKDQVGASKISATASISRHHDQKTTQDQCPPMCHCGCCNMQVVITSKLVIRPMEGKLLALEISHIPEKPVTQPSNIWQPPKLNA